MAEPLEIPATLTTAASVVAAWPLLFPGWSPSTHPLSGQPLRQGLWDLPAPPDPSWVVGFPPPVLVESVDDETRRVIAENPAGWSLPRVFDPTEATPVGNPLTRPGERPYVPVPLLRDPSGALLVGPDLPGVAISAKVAVLAHANADGLRAYADLDLPVALARRYRAEADDVDRYGDTAEALIGPLAAPWYAPDALLAALTAPPGASPTTRPITLRPGA